MSDELPGDLRPVVDFFGLPGTAVVAKDFHVVRAIRVLATFDASPFVLERFTLTGNNRHGGRSWRIPVG